jgi:hypothetical protein
VRTVHLPGGREERLGWYRFFVYNRSVAGSMLTLVHLPFMLSFLSLTIIGAMAGKRLDGNVLILSLAVVAMLLYAEHMLDDTRRVGKPWNTVLSDRALLTVAAVLFIASMMLALYASLRYGTEIPLIGVMIGIMFTILYGLEVRGFHTIAFGGIGMGAVTPFSYIAQAMAAGTGWSVAVALLLFAFGSCYGYVLLALYENTKTGEHSLSWKLLGVQFLMVYALAAASLVMRA